jgi:hypothetical protein
VKRGTIVIDIKMLSYSNNQTMQYAYQLLRQDSIPVKDAFTMLRDYSVAIAGLEIPVLP